MAVATHLDVAVALGRSIDSAAEQAQVEWWLAGVELIIASRLGDLSALKQDALTFVEVEVVAAKVQRGDSRLASKTVASDDTTVTKQYATAPVSVSDITDDWWALLNPLTGSDFYSTRPGFEPDNAQHSAHTPFVWPLERGWYS